MGPGHHRLVIGGGGVADAHHHAVLGAVASQGEILVGLGGHGDVLDVALGGGLVPLELLDGGFGDVLLGLGSLIHHIQIGPLKVDAQDLGALVALLHHVGNVGHGGGQDLLALGDGGGQEAGHALRDDVLGPVAQALGVCVVGVELKGPVAVNIHKAGDDAFVAVIHIHRAAAIGGNLCDFASLQPDGGGHKLVGDPYLFALKNHKKLASFESRVHRAKNRPSWLSCIYYNAPAAKNICNF